VLAFLTDADLRGAAIARNSEYLAECVTATQEIQAILAESKFVPIDSGFTAARSSALEPCAAEGWLAAGDASLSFDPLSAQGLLHAMFTGLAAAQTADAYLVGDRDAVRQYRELMGGIRRAYHKHLDLCYASETRWPSSPFWKRRQYAALSLLPSDARSR
jgi:flavin-dependent dehydrogenase